VKPTLLGMPRRLENGEAVSMSKGRLLIALVTIAAFLAKAHHGFHTGG
jgi:hypothetical protein